MTRPNRGDALGSASDQDFFEYLLRLGDDRLVLGHRLSEWCGHAPILEEDIALANIALDLVGEATLLLTVAAKVENAGRDADALAFLRDAIDYRNVLLVELPKGDFAVTIARQFFFSAFSVLQAEALQKSANQDLAGIAAKMLKEARYHLRHSGEWMLKLGAGTDESHRRLQDAVNALWRYTGELFFTDELEQRLVEPRIAVDASTLEPRWREQVMDILDRATVTVPEEKWMQRGGRSGRHTEHLGHMLAYMQVLQRQHPGASW
ncbi:MAG TPA: 1,2-phenylacetyl-CoA epoxidase subunit PaaC [Gemmatimonadaceae bacterium]|nr:1,2-phenylacetyl-CoA epoxidase subunit PaaC [Gemmatimonadaceae bacterium]